MGISFHPILPYLHKRNKRTNVLSPWALLYLIIVDHPPTAHQADAVLDRVDDVADDGDDEEEDDDYYRDDDVALHHFGGLGGGVEGVR